MLKFSKRIVSLHARHQFQLERRVIMVQLLSLCFQYTLIFLTYCTLYPMQSYKIYVCKLLGVYQEYDTQEMFKCVSSEVLQIDIYVCVCVTVCKSMIVFSFLFQIMLITVFKRQDILNLFINSFTSNTDIYVIYGHKYSDIYMSLTVLKHKQK